MVAPVFVGVLSYAIARLLIEDRPPQRYSVTIIVESVFLAIPILEFPFLGPLYESRSLAAAVAAWALYLSEAFWIGVQLALTVGGAVLAYRTILRYGERATTVGAFSLNFCNKR